MQRKQRNKKKVLVSLVLDEMSIKKGLQRLRNRKVRGYVDFGSFIENIDNLPFAKDVLVLVVVSLDSNWKIPIAYFFINGIDSETNAGIINTALSRLYDAGVTIVSVTLDGPTQHFATMRKLEVNFNIEKPLSFFLHPSTNKVYVIFYACHMLKLVQNYFGDWKVFRDGEGNDINWDFIKELYYLQEEKGLLSGNKLKKEHIRYWKMKMKVSLAAQTLSSSVADSISFCDKQLSLPKFKNSEATVRFIRCVDRIFYFLNSRNPLAKGFKSPLRVNNESYWRPRILEEVNYLKTIANMEGVQMCYTKRHVGFTGFTAIYSVIAIFNEYVKQKNSQLRYLLTYKLSQDHIKLFFCAIRSCGGWCPNPTVTVYICIQEITYIIRLKLQMKMLKLWIK